MALRYKEAFGLRDNPFGPRMQFGKVPPYLTQELEKRPLLLHKDAGLDPLYCDKIPSFKMACDKLEASLEADGYSLDPVSRGVAPYLVAIEGDRGAGKTTLASRMLQLVRKRSPAGDQPWHVEELLLKSNSQTATDQAELLKDLEKKVLDANPVYSCVLIDDLLADAYPYATQLYDNLRAKCTIFMIFTSFDQKMAEQIDKSVHSVQRFSIAALSPDDAIAYVAARYQLYRDPDAKGIGALPLFPFDEADIRTAVKVRTWSAANTTGPVNMRLVGSILAAALTSRLQEIALSTPKFDINAATADQLAQLTIKVAQRYKLVVRT